MKSILPPKHLPADTAAWFGIVIKDYELDSHHIRLLLKACEAWDRSEQAREAIAAHGMTYVDRFGSPRARPECAIERDSRSAFARLVRELGLDVAPNSVQNGDVAIFSDAECYRISAFYSLSLAGDCKTSALWNDNKPAAFALILR